LEFALRANNTLNNFALSKTLKGQCIEKIKWETLNGLGRTVQFFFSNLFKNALCGYGEDAKQQKSIKIVEPH
jgi:hypothetical protein